MHPYPISEAAEQVEWFLFSTEDMVSKELSRVFLTGQEVKRLCRESKSFVFRSSFSFIKTKQQIKACKRLKDVRFLSVDQSTTSLPNSFIRIIVWF